ncbi:MAG: hypothetical protein SF053_04990 [Bacteroidia bacterium]|nr:hypothetical protein [Bacteroidia bacterium]
MKSLLFRLCAALLCCVPIWLCGQGVTITDSAFVPFEQMMDSVFGLVDLSGVSSPVAQRGCCA